VGSDTLEGTNGAHDGGLTKQLEIGQSESAALINGSAKPGPPELELVSTTMITGCSSVRHPADEM
jgi:hypothetical protein